jgi:hypothetical protein
MPATRLPGSPMFDFETARAQDYEGGDFDLVTMFDALHDMGGPVGAAAHARSSLKPDGTLMVIVPQGRTAWMRV